MRSIGLALVWESWRRTRRHVLLGGLLLSLLALFFAWQMGFRTAAPGDSAAQMLHFWFVMSATALLVLLLVQAQCDEGDGRFGFPRRLHRLPAPTWEIVAWQMAAGTAWIAQAYLGLAALFYLLTGIVWPLWGPTLFAAAALALMQTAVWCASGFVRPLMICLALWPLATAAIAFYGEGRRRPSPWGLWRDGPTELLFAGVCLVGAYLVGVRGVARDRRGDAQGPTRLREWWDRVAGRRAQRRKPFPSPASAQFWMEWRQKGFLAPLSFAAFVVAQCALPLPRFLLAPSGVPESGTLLVFAAEWLFSFIYVSPWVFAGCAFFAGVFVGQSDPFGRRAEIDALRATRPVPDPALSRAALRAGLASVLATVGAWAALVLVWTGILVLSGGLREVVIGWRGLAAATGFGGLARAGSTGALLLSGAWVLFGLGVCVGLAGRRWLGVTLAGTAATLALGSALLLGAGRVSIAAFAAIAWPSVVAVSLTGTAAALALARWKGLVGRRGAMLLCGAWFALTVVALCAGGQANAPPLRAHSLALALPALAVAPLAMAPLALAWNRHR